MSSRRSRTRFLKTRINTREHTRPTRQLGLLRPRQTLPPNPNSSLVSGACFAQNVPMRIARWTLLLAFGLMLSGCGMDRQKPDFTILNGTEPETLDPHIITGQPEFRLVEALFEGLYAHDPVTAEAVPGVAVSHELSADHRTYTFHLRKDARWSNGDPLTARDFVESWQRALEPETAADYAYLLYFIKNAKLFNEGKLKDFSQVGVRA